MNIPKLNSKNLQKNKLNRTIISLLKIELSSQFDISFTIKTERY